MVVFNPLEQEKQVLDFWTTNKIREESLKKNKGKKKFYFLQGPPYTSGRLHLGQAWNNSMKDAVLRFKRMSGFDVFDRAGYDMHGLPTEQKVMEKHDLKLTKDIHEFGEEKFSQECLAYCTQMMEYMNTDLQRLGVFMDFENAYQPVSNEYIEGIWKFIKRADQEKRLYKGKRTMGWSPVFATALAKHEMVYKTVMDTSVFVKFALKDEQNTSLVIWTTTPWTLPFNLAIMVNPDAQYVKVKVKESGEILIVAKDLAAVFLQSVLDKEYKILETMTGETLEGLHYEHFWKKDMPAMTALEGYDALHTVVVSSKYVDTSGGSGLVHCAPGCGPEDYEVGHEYGLPAFNEVDEHGFFPESMGIFSGWKARTDDHRFIEQLKKDGVLLATNDVEHEYPHDERSGEPIIFRTTEQWFFKTEDLKDRMVEFNKNTHWVPQKGKNAFHSWLSNLRDNSITKQRFWGTPVPIWVSEEDPNDYIVVGSVKELQDLGATVPQNLHKPFIDAVTFTKDGKKYTRILDVLDVWIDSGAASWNALSTLDQNESFEKWFPADFILEGKDQIRGWYNLLMVCSTIMFDKPAFSNVFMHGFISGVDGEKMSKSLGNIISPYEIVDKYGADTLRSYMQKIRAGEDVSFSWDEIKLSYRNLNMLANICTFLEQMDQPITLDISTLALEDEDAYILSILHRGIQTITDLYSTYQIHLVVQEFEKILIELSRSYIQSVRDITDQRKPVVASVLYHVLKNLLLVSHPTIPFLTEQLYAQLKTIQPNDTFEKSILLEDWPQVQTSFCNEQLETEFVQAQSVIQGILAARDQSSIGVRWPLAKAIICVKDTPLHTSITRMQELICTQTNVKELELITSFDNVTYSVKPNYKELGKTFGQQTGDVAKAIQNCSKDDVQQMVQSFNLSKSYALGEFEITKDHVTLQTQVAPGYAHAPFQFGDVYLVTEQTQELELEGFAREFSRRIQSFRKDQGLSKKQTISLAYTADVKLSKAIQTHMQELLARCGLEKLQAQENIDVKNTQTGKIKDQEFTFTQIN